MIQDISKSSDLLENMHQRLMRAYHALGRRAEALATYRRCRKTLATVLKLAPLPRY